MIALYLKYILGTLNLSSWHPRVTTVYSYILPIRAVGIITLNLARRFTQRAIIYLMFYVVQEW